MNIWQNYKKTIVLLCSLILGVILGLVFKEDIVILKPLGDLFLNFLFILIIPLVFLTITTSIARMKEPKRLTKIMSSIIGVFLVTSFVSVIVGLASTLPIKLVNASEGQTLKLELMKEGAISNEVELNILERTVDVLSVDDFSLLLSKDHMIALVVVSILVGIAIRLTKEKGKPFFEFLDSANYIILKLVDLVMYYAPIGLCCYIASFVGTFGASIAIGYLKTFVIYTIVCILFFIFVYSFYAYLAGGKVGVKRFWRNILSPTLTALATCSSAASIPSNIDAAKNIGVSDDIADTIIPLGTSFHKDGSIIGSVFKIMFLVYLFNTPLDAGKIFQILGVALVANLLVTAVPIGGGTISEMLIITLLGYPVYALPVLTIIATIIDAPATVLNVTGDSVSSMLVARLVDGKNWMQEKFSNL